MKFRAELFPKSFPVRIEHGDKLLLIGSCFTEQIGAKLLLNKFGVLQNPSGILFNPISIAKALTSYAADKLYTESELMYHNELWGSWQHHTKFSGIDKAAVLENINASQQQASDFLKSADWILVTLGSAFVYERLDEPQGPYVVANCHKAPAEQFTRRLCDNPEVRECLIEMMQDVHSVNPKAKFIYTISPVRHLREGFIENNLSKATLIQAVHAVTNKTNVFYFPSYELVLDDLRDYRFYAEDLVHPNYAATNYVWEKFIDTVICNDTILLIKDLTAILAAWNHKAFNPNSAQHRKFLETHAVKAKELQHKYPHLDLQEEISYFEQPTPQSPTLNLEL